MFTQMPVGSVSVAVLMVFAISIDSRADDLQPDSVALDRAEPPFEGGIAGVDMTQDFESGFSYVAACSQNGWTCGGAPGVFSIVNSGIAGFGTHSIRDAATEIFPALQQIQSPLLPAAQTGVVAADIVISDTSSLWQFTTVNTLAGSGFFNTRINFELNGAITALQVTNSPPCVSGIFLPTNGTWAPGVKMRIGIEIQPGNVLRVYKDGVLIFTGEDIAQHCAPGDPDIGATQIRDFNSNVGNSSTLTIDNISSSLAGPQACQLPLKFCASDIAPFPNGDGLTNAADLLLVINTWGQNGNANGQRPPGDLAPLPNGDCIVNAADLLGVINAWGPCPQQVGACCLPNGGCLNAVTVSQCLANGGVHHGVGTNCNLTICPVLPVNDECANAMVVTNGSFTISNVDATTSLGIPGAACTFGGPQLFKKDVWLKYTATCTGPINMNLCSTTGAATDTVISVLSGSCGDLTEVACDDDSCGSASDFHSAVEFMGLAGTQYFVRVGSWNNSPTGSMLLTITCSPTGLLCFGDQAMVLDGSGTFTMPGWQSPGTSPFFYVNTAQLQPPLTIVQQPAPGTLLNGVQSVEASVVVFDAIGQSDSCKFVLSLVDKTPPSLTISAVVDGQSIVAPAQIVPQIAAVDNADPSPQITARLDGQTYVPGTPIQAVGIHRLRVEAVDDSSNYAAEVVTFEIRKRPLKNAVAVIADLTCNADGIAFGELDATVLVASSEFIVNDINLYTVDLWVLDSHGKPLNNKPIPLAGSVHPAGGYNYATTEAMYQNGYWQFHFHATPADQMISDCPAAILITGTANVGLSNSVDFHANADAVVDPNPVQTLTTMGLTNQDPPHAPVFEPQWPNCEWQAHLFTQPPDVRLTSVTVPCFGALAKKSLMYLVANGGIWGFADALDVVPCTGTIAATSTVEHRMFLVVWLQGPADCCNCSIQCAFTPIFEIRLQVDEVASATASGLIDVDSNRCIAQTFGSRTLNTAGTITHAPVLGSCFNVINNCAVVVEINSVASLNVFADATLFNPAALAIAQIRDSSPGVEIVATCQATRGPCVGESLAVAIK